MNDNEKIEVIKKWLGKGSINIFGRPFAGKDTQGIRLAKLLDASLIGGGEILRSASIPDPVKESMKTGQLIPSEEYITIVLPYLSQPIFADKPMVLSSIGRWKGEEEGVIKTLEESNHPLKAVVYLNISDHDSRHRWLAREIYKDRDDRHDDAKSALQIRFDEFNQKTIPVIDFYRDMGILSEIDGKLTREEVTSKIIDTLYKQSKR